MHHQLLTTESTANGLVANTSSLPDLMRFLRASRRLGSCLISGPIILLEAVFSGSISRDDYKMIGDLRLGDYGQTRRKAPRTMRIRVKRGRPVPRGLRSETLEQTILCFWPVRIALFIYDLVSKDLRISSSSTRNNVIALDSDFVIGSLISAFNVILFSRLASDRQFLPTRDPKVSPAPASAINVLVANRPSRNAVLSLHLLVAGSIWLTAAQGYLSRSNCQ
jgi:hypothetical protein